MTATPGARLRADGSFPLAARAESLVGSVIDSSTSLLASQTHDIVRFAMGAPADEAVPVEVLRQLAASRWKPDSFTYGATEGEPELLDAIEAFLAHNGTPTARERLFVTTGGMQGLDLAFKLFVDPGDLVFVESPTYTNGTATALSYGARVVEVPMDEEGMQVDLLPGLARQAGATPKAIYTIPTFQNPSGATLSLRRRTRLLELAHEWGAVIVDDDPYGLLRFQGEEISGFPQLSPDDPLVFSIRTFSKILAPGLRVGWIEANPALHPVLINAKQAMDTCTNVPAQHIVAGFLAQGGMGEHLAGLRREYRRRKEAMLDSVRRHLGDRVRTTDPEGGFFLWLTLLGEDASIRSDELFPVALEEGVAFIPGTVLSPTGRFADALRLCFASTTPERCEEGLVRLTRALDRARVSA